MRFDSFNRFTLLLSLQDAGSIGAPASGGEVPAPSPSAPTTAPASAPSTVAPASPVPGGDPLAQYEYTGLGDLAEQLMKGPPEAPATDPGPTLTATPDGPPALGEPVPIPGEGEASPATPAPVDQFQALKSELETQKTTLTAKEQELATTQGKLAQFETYAPAVEAMRTNPGLVELVNMLQPVVSAGLTGFEDPRAAEIGAAFIKNLDQYDQRVSSALINGTLAFYGKDITEKALARIGIAEGDIPDYQRWKASNGAATPAFALDKFPEPDEQGLALIPITDPRTNSVRYEQVDVNDDDGLYKYNAEKDRFSVAQENKRREVETRTAEQQRSAEQRTTQERQVAQEQQTRVVDWSRERGQAEIAAYEKLSPAFTGEFERFSTAASSMAHTEMFHDPEYQRLLREGQVAAHNGEGRAAAIAADIDRVAEKHIASAVTFYSDIAARLTAAEAATQDGKPRLPVDAPKIGAETQLTRSAPVSTPGSDSYLYNGNEGEKLTPKAGEDYVDFVRRVNRGSLGSRMVAQAR